MSIFICRSTIALWVGICLGVISPVLPAQEPEISVLEVPRVTGTIEGGSIAEQDQEEDQAKVQEKEKDQEPEVDSNQPHEDLDAVLWIQTSAEYDAIARQTFRAARAAVGDALVDSSWTASTEQQKMSEDQAEGWLAGLPPAVVLDVDETVLDNSSYQVSLIESDGEYSRDGWKAFVEKQVSTPIPGAVDFVNACRAAGVTVIYVTNREHEVETATRENLIKHGLMGPDDPDLILTKNEKEEWTSDKKTRRLELAKEYRILLLLGDDLNDLIATEYHSSSEARRETGDKYKSWFGERWFMLPNPNYGGWERSLYDWENAISPSSKRKRKRENMVR